MIKAAFLTKSSNPDKKYNVAFRYNGDVKRIDFGQADAEDYTISKNGAAKEAYIARHEGQEDWNDPLTAGYWAKHILWSEKTINQSINKLLEASGIAVYNFIDSPESSPLYKQSNNQVKEKAKAPKKAITKKIVAPEKARVPAPPALLEMTTKKLISAQARRKREREAEAAREAHEILMNAIQEPEPAPREPAPARERKKITKKPYDKTMNIRTHLRTLTLKQVQAIARQSNLQMHIKLTSPKEQLIEAVAQLYEHENGKYKSKPFVLQL